MENGQTDGRPSDVDSQIGSQASDASEGQAAERPAAPAAIPLEALLALTQALKLTHTGARTEVRPPSFNGEGDLTLFLKHSYLRILIPMNGNESATKAGVVRGFFRVRLLRVAFRRQ